MFLGPGRGAHTSPARSVSLGVGPGLAARRALGREWKPTPGWSVLVRGLADIYLRRIREGAAAGGEGSVGELRGRRACVYTEDKRTGRWRCGTHHVATAVSLSRRQTQGSEQLHTWL